MRLEKRASGSAERKEIDSMRIRCERTMCPNFHSAQIVHDTCMLLNRKKRAIRAMLLIKLQKGYTASSARARVRFVPRPG